MKTTLPVLLVLALVPLSACAPKVNDPADVQAIKQSIDAYFEAGNARNPLAVAAMATDKTGWYEPHMPAVIGKDAIAKLYQAFFDQFDIEMKWQVVDVRVVGDLGVAHGTYTQKIIPRTEGAAATSDSGNWVVVLQRQGDGSWKWDRAISNSDQPMPGTTADGVEEQAVMQTVRELSTAVVKRDMATLDRLAAKERNLFEDGQAVDVAKATAEFKSGALQIESDTERDLAVHVFGEAAIATMVGETKSTHKGKAFSGPYRATNFYIKRNGQWQLVSGQISSITQ